MDPVTMRPAWICSIANAVQAIVGALCGCLDADRLDRALERTPEPRDETERMLFRTFLGDVVMDALRGRSGVRRDKVNTLIDLWPRLRREESPVAVLRRALVHKPARRLSASRHALAAKARAVITERYAERVLLRDLARQWRVCPSHLNRTYRAVYGRTLHQDLMHERVRHGLHLVKDGVKIEAAALSVGFRSKKDFYRAVRRQVGCTPAQFRSRSAAPAPSVDDDREPPSAVRHSPLTPPGS